MACYYVKGFALRPRSGARGLTALRRRSRVEANCYDIVVPEDGAAQRHQGVLGRCEESQPYDCCRFV